MISTTVSDNKTELNFINRDTKFRNEVPVDESLMLRGKVGCLAPEVINIQKIKNLKVKSMKIGLSTNTNQNSLTF